MKYIEDWEKRKERLTALWDLELIDRCCVAVKYVDYAKQNYRRPANEEEIQKSWTDGEWLFERAKAQMETTYFAGDTFPNFFINMGVSAHAAYFKGADFSFAENTTWFFPSLGNVEELVLDENETYYRKLISAAEYLTGMANGDFCISMPDFSGNADALAHLRGSENLLIDFIEKPEAVKKALKIIQEQYEKTVTGVYDIVKENNEGGSTVGWMNTWAPGLYSQMQSDISVMISNEQYEEFIMPELRAQTDLMDFSTYHFDGIEQIRHLDSLLSIEKLKMIQWTHVDGQPKPYEYMESLKRIQAAGKALLLFPSPNDIPIYMENLSSKGLLMVLDVYSKEEADEIVKTVTKLTRE